MPEGQNSSSEIVIANLCSWDRSAIEAMGALITRHMIRTPSVTVLRVDFKKGATMPPHHHVHEQVTMLESGRLRLIVDGNEIILKPGDILRIPPDVPHFTEALADSSTIEVFTPAREDIPCPDAAFLRGIQNRTE
jgi:quercetin dioxygenase-like cupin family protein